MSQTSALKEMVRVLFTRIRLLARVLARARVMARIKWIRLIYLFLNIGKTRNLSLKKQQISLVFLHSLRIVISFHRYIAGKTYSFPKAWPMYNKIKANMGLNCLLCLVNNFYTHLATKHAS